MKPFDEKLYQCMLKTLDHNSQCFLYINKNEAVPFYANRQALLHFADINGVIDIEQIFRNEEAPTFLRETIIEQLKLSDYVMLYDIPVTGLKEGTKFCQVQIGYSDDEHNTLFVEIFYPF